MGIELPALPAALRLHLGPAVDCAHLVAQGLGGRDAHRIAPATEIAARNLARATDVATAAHLDTAATIDASRARLAYIAQHGSSDASRGRGTLTEIRGLVDTLGASYNTTELQARLRGHWFD